VTLPCIIFAPVAERKDWDGKKNEAVVVEKERDI
jgi:hypothetical protein